MKASKTIKVNNLKVRVNNKKLEGIIFNMNSATDCPSAKLGMCAHCNKCYALKAEKIYPQVLPFRRAQEKYFDNSDVNTMIEDFKQVIKVSKTNKPIRISESGDFKNQDAVTKLTTLVNNLPINSYIYTARKDLNFDNRNKLVVNGSGFMIDNMFKAYDKKTIEEFKNFKKSHPKTAKKIKFCAGDCTICNLCTKKGNNFILVAYH